MLWADSPNLLDTGPYAKPPGPGLACHPSKAYSKLPETTATSFTRVPLIGCPPVQQITPNGEHKWRGRRARGSHRGALNARNKRGEGQ